MSSANLACESKCATNNHKTLAGYLIGFFLSLLLTIASFGAVMLRCLSTENCYIVLTFFACMQLFVQATFFLRLNNSAESRDNLLTFLFTLLIIAILVAGSLWIMYNLNYRMM